MTEPFYRLGKSDNPEGFELKRKLGGSVRLYRMAWSPRGDKIAAGCRDSMVRVWDAASGDLVKTLKGHTDTVLSVTWSADGQTLASGSRDGSIRIWDVNSWTAVEAHEDHGGWAPVAWSSEGLLASGTKDSAVRIWRSRGHKLFRELKGHKEGVNCVAWARGGRFLASAADDRTVRVWDLEANECKHVLEGHEGDVWAVAWTPDGSILASGGVDKTVVLWDFVSGKKAGVLEGHLGEITGLDFSSSGRLLASKAEDNTVRLWRSGSWDVVAVLEETIISNVAPVLFHPTLPQMASLGDGDRWIRIWQLDLTSLLGSAFSAPTVKYRNAKVAILGDAGVGKSGLAGVLAGESFEPTPSTHGRRVRTLATMRDSSKEAYEESREVLLWDLAGQPEYRLVNQLSLGETDVAVVLFDASKPNDPFAGVTFWDKALQQACPNSFPAKLLVAARSDVSTAAVTSEVMKEFAKKNGYSACFEVSALTGNGIAELRIAVLDAIDWYRIPFTVSERTFKEMKDFARNLARQDMVISTDDLLARFQLARPDADVSLGDCVGALERLETNGLVKNLSVGGVVLLKPEVLDNYASRMAQAAREEPHGEGFLREEFARTGAFTFGSLDRVKDEQDEKVILQAAVELFIKMELAIRDEGKLIFPSQVNREQTNDATEDLAVSYVFEGSVTHVYTILTVRLYHSDAFVADALYKNAAFFLPYARREREHRCGIIADDLGNGTNRLSVVFGALVEEGFRALFLKYIDEQLNKRVIPGSLKRERVYRCPKCCNQVDPSAVLFRKKQGERTIRCNHCQTVDEIQLIDHIERSLGSDEVLEEVRRIDRAIDVFRDNQSKEAELIGHVMVLAGRTGQLFRPTTMWDHGIDGEIEFKDDDGIASGCKIYLQLKSGPSHLKRRKDGTQSFRIEKKRHREYWQQHAYPVYLVVLDADGKIYWLNVTEKLKKADASSRSIEFDGQELTEASVMNVRKLALAALRRQPSGPQNSSQI